ncbi:hypothetical protein ACN08Y_10355 [Rothia sp. P5764]|uniref:hypothetical protein n=1 Tax=Rothia sp. P5764 TaxID=3402654 RepID=UPI003AC35BB5
MTPDMQATINRLKELEKQASSEPWICKTIQYSNEEIYYELVNGRGKVLLDVLEASNIPEKDLFLIVDLRNAVPALIAHHEATSRKLAIYEKRLAYIAKNYPLVHADVLEHAPEQEN